MTNRRARNEFSKRVKIQRWDWCVGCCEYCGAKLRPGQFEYDHDLEVAEGGTSTFENCVVLCKTCHKAKTKQRAPALAKSRRREEKHIGVKKPKGWQSRFKRKVDGTVVLRETGEPVR